MYVEERGTSVINYVVTNEIAREEVKKVREGERRRQTMYR